ncbi:hypothetical protein PIB30_074566 [Stylosanthes scabra]|uniref:Uncharacterized protein n=1 Tax=Stylosanthes scabra TaxID=79078 RepID=A0ABU6XRK1_9FABA|nr:hypothetical protein [Stylosanthes scabra]
MASSSSASFDAHRFGSPYHLMRTEEEITKAEAHPYKSYVRGVEIDFSAENIKQILRIRDHTPGAESDFDKRQREDQRLDEGDNVRAEELIADNIVITAEQPQGRSKLAFPSTIDRLCKAAEQGFQQINEELANLKIQQEKFFESMQNTQAQYLEELKALKTRQDDLDPIEKMQEMIHQQYNEIIEMRSQIKEWTKNASSSEAYYCWAHQQANPNLVQIPIHDIPKFSHDNDAKGKHIFQGALKIHEQGEPSQSVDVPMAEPEKE